jgi:hypothetical protein
VWKCDRVLSPQFHYSQPQTPQVAHDVLLVPMLSTGDFDWKLGWVLRKLVKHKPPTATRVYLWGLQHAATPAEYTALLPVVQASVPAEVFGPMAEEFKLLEPGKVVA